MERKFSYRISAKLKEAAYPQLGEGRVFHSSSINADGENGCLSSSDMVPYYFPSLSDLIENCPRIDGISRLKKGSETRWYAFCRSDRDGMSSGVTEIEGNTPEDAVAKLYLYLYLYEK